MASGSPAPSNVTSGTAAVAPSAHANYIEEKLEKTGTDVQVVEVSTTILTMFVFVLVYLLTMVIIDQWLVPEGLGSGIRACALVLLLGSLVFYAIRNLLPHLLYRVNPAFAALTIERSEPSLKNSVLNFLLVRHTSRNVPGVVIRGMEKQAATGLARVSVDSVVDHRQLIKGGIVFVVTVLIWGLYMVFSPKNMLPTVGRLLVPWADIEPVRRIRIDHVHPGNSSVLFRSHVTVSAEVHGLRDGEMVFLVYSSRSGGAVDQRIQMFCAANETAYSCLLPESEGGLVGDVQYRIEAGDCVSQTYQLDLITAPSLQVQKIEYHYPSYTGMESRSVEDVGDIKAIEGSRVVIHAEANQDIFSAAVILKLDYSVEGDRNVTRPMALKNRLAKCQLLLERHIVRQQSIPEFTGYHLHLATPNGAVNENAIRHRIAITRDQSPVVEILRPEESFVEVPENGDLFFHVRARDPDFSIAELFLVGRLDDQTLFEEDLIQHHKAGGQPLRAAYREVFRFLPQSYQLTPGQSVQVVVRATDNKRPEPNVVFSKPVEIHITAADENFSGDSENNNEPSGADDRQAESQGSGESAGGQAGAEESSGDESSGDGAGEATSKQDGQDGNEERSEQAAGKGAADASAGQTDSQEQQAGGSQEKGGQSGQTTNPNSNNPESEPRGAMDGSDQGDGGNKSGSSERGNESEGKVDNDGDAFQHLSEKIHEEQSQEHEQHGGDSNGAAPDNRGDGSGAEKDGQQQSVSETEASQDGNNRPYESKGGPGSERNGSKENSGREKRRQGEGQSQGEPSTRDKNQSPSDGDSDAGAKSSREEGGGTGNAGEQPPSPPEGAGEKRRRSGKQNRSEQQDKEPADSGVSNHESDSAEGKEGSRHGKGEEGGGQQSSQSGEGAGGSHTPAPAGKGAAKEPGFGETGDRAGNSGLTDEATGNHTAERGDADEGNPQGDSPQEHSNSSEGGQSGGSQGADGRQASDNQSQGPSPQSSQQGPSGAGATEGATEGESALGGKASGDDPDIEDGPVVEPGADAPNLEYARETTALVLDYLQDQLDRGGIDPELKRKFGWTDEEFVDFVNRYRHLMRKAQQSGDEGRRAEAEWESALRSLGLKQPGQALRQGNMRAEKAHGLQEINRSRPPQAEQERFDAFRKDILSR